MKDRIFGTDGIRAKAGQYPLDDDTIYKIGQAIGEFFKQANKPILIAWDPRESSPNIRDQLTQGISDQAMDVIHAGMMPTPALAYLTNISDMSAGVMITASHNPYSDNGIKIFLPDGNKLSDELEDQLNSLINTDIAVASKKGHVTSDNNLIKKYIDFLAEQADLPKKLKVAFDCANGAASDVIKPLIDGLNIEATIINASPDGQNINRNCGATDTAQLSDTVIKNECDLGLAYDGDADRLIAVDSNGNQINGDTILYILAVTGRHSKIAATVMSNLGFEDALKEKDIELIRTDVGDRYVLEAMHKNGLLLGGEQSGHIILGRLATTGDGILASIVLLNDIIGSNKSLSEWAAEVKAKPQSIVNIEVQDKQIIYSTKIVQFIDSTNRKFEGKGRLLIRPSGTEPKIRVMVESDDAESQAKIIARDLQALINDSLTSFPVSEEMKSVVSSIITEDRADLINQLIIKSKQDNILRSTPKDASSRFVSVEHFHAWKSKGRVVHWLVSESDDLAGIIWYGKAKFPQDVSYQSKPDYTFAIRLYDGYQGHGLAVPFMKQSLKIYSQTADNSLDGIWLQTDIDNGAAIHVYSKVGYKEVGRDDKRVTMIIERETIDEIAK